LNDSCGRVASEVAPTERRPNGRDWILKASIDPFGSGCFLSFVIKRAV
jgi:hypothetical protein